MFSVHRLGRPSLAIAATVITAAVAAAPAAADPRPATVPAVGSFTASSGTFTLRRDARVAVRTSERRALRGEARTLAADLGELLHRTVHTSTRARTGDIVLTRRGADPGDGDEGYTLRLGRLATIAAPASAGLYYGGRTVLQLLRAGTPIARGIVHDVPRYAERGLMVDCGRQYFDRAWWLREIRRLSDLKLNLVHMHLSDDQGFRIEVPSHPEIVSAKHLSREDVAALVAEAARRHVTLVPEVDMPGHMTAALAKHPDLQLADVTGQRQPDKLDVTLPAARLFAHQIVADVMAQFPGPWYHAGADEYLGIASTSADYLRYPQLEAYADAKHGANANGKDAVLDFVNEIAAQVHAAGKEMRVWSDGAGGGSAVTLDRRAVIEWWENAHSATPADVVTSGHRILNVGWWPLYYVTGGPLMSLRTTEQDMYEQWEPRHFEGPYTLRWFGGPSTGTDLHPHEPRQLGATLAVWNDDPTTAAAQPAAIASGIQARLEILAQQTWGSPKLATTYADFQKLAARVRDTG